MPGLLAVAQGVEQFGVQGQLQAAVHHDQVRLAWHVKTTHIELRVVFEHGADAGEHGAGAGAPGVAIGTRLGAGDPLALTIGQRGLAVNRGGDLHAHPGQTTLHAAEKTDVELARFDGQWIVCGQQLDLHTGGLKPCQALACDLGVGVAHGRDHLADACGGQRIAARAGAALVGTGFERDPGGGAAHVVAAGCGIAQGHDFGMRATRALGVAFAQHGAVGGGDDAAHAGVGRGQPQGLVGQIEGAA